MHLVSIRRQTVRFGRGEFTVHFEAGESIWTEACHKYTLRGIEELASASGFQLEQQWVDHEWPFADSLFRAV
jgi:L-histidine N-alpha-methyltransferase